MNYQPIVESYIRNIQSGNIVACRWVRLCAERHLRDLEDGAARGLVFREDKAERAIRFFQFLKHSKGEWAGSVISLEPWQQFILWVLFGWYRTDGTRRFRLGYEEIARKNGKTTIAAGIGLYMLIADGEAGAEVYTAATKKDQARIAHGEATRMVKASSHLRSRIGIFKDNLHVLPTNSKYEPLGRDADSLDGLNVSCALVDEVHAHKTRDLWDVLETATGSRRQPLMFAITTAGFNRFSICYELHDYTKKVLEGIVEDDSFFGIIFTVDEGDNWEDEKVWAKANPNLGVSVKVEDLRRKAKKAKAIPSHLNNFLRLHLNIWTQAETRWLPVDAWNKCGLIPIDFDALAGRTCYAGLDLASTTDLAAMVLVFPPVDDSGIYTALPRFWIPADAIIERSRRDRVPYEAWERAGLVTATPGNVIDYKFILEQISRDAETYDLRQIAFDRWGATKLVQDIEDMGFTKSTPENPKGERQLVGFGQGFASMSPPTKEMEKLVLSGKLAHGNNPVLNWCADNLVVKRDPAGNLKPDKEKSIEKIDGMVATIMGLARAVVNQEPDEITQGFVEI